MTEVLTVPCSPEQADVIVAHGLGEIPELGMQPDERQWILAQVARLRPGARVTSAHLVVDEGQWQVTVAT